MVNIKLSAVCVIFAVAPALIALSTKHLAPTVQWTPTVPFVTLSDGRRLAYEIRGNPNSKHSAIYIHGTPSCRLEFLGLSQGILDSVGLRLVGVDKPGYGQSDPHYGRSLRSFVADLEQLADHLKLQRFLLIGVSGGGPYSWATARYAPHRVQGMLILSGAGNLGILDAHERAKFDAQVSGVHRRIANFFHSTYSTPLKSLLSYMFETKIGGRQLYSTVLKPLMRDPTRFMADPDKDCLQQGHQEYTSRVVPEALRQESATPWVQDLGLFSGDWGFSVSDIEPHVKPTIHLWHGTGDRQVSEVMTVAFKRLVPQATLHIINGGAHFQYFVCNLKQQKEALTALIQTST
ncbi:hypothetical protein ABBQ32_013916 [Trebouxia sp. C0010 RCD-2024]